MSNGHDEGFTRSLLGLPQWIKAVAIIGIPGLISIYLVWLGGQTLPRIEQGLLLLKSDVAKNQELVREIRGKQDEMYRLQLRTCAIAAKTDFQRGQCYDSGR